MTALEKLQGWLEEKGMSQTGFAANIERSRPYVSQLLSGQTRPGLETALRIEKVTRRRVLAKEWVAE